MVGYLHLFIIEQASRIYTSVLSALLAEEAQLESVVEQARRGRRRRPQQAQTLPPAETMLTADSERVRVEEALEAGAVHVGYRMWERLGLSAVLQAAGLPRRACLLSEAMTLNRLIFPFSPSVPCPIGFGTPPPSETRTATTKLDSRFRGNDALRHCGGRPQLRSADLRPR